MKNKLTGLIAGIINGLFSAGGGLILVPAFIYFLNLDERKARATTLFCTLPMTITTAIVYSKSNFINWNLGVKCAIGGILGGMLGGKLLNKLPIKYLKLSFIIFLFYAGINIIF